MRFNKLETFKRDNLLVKFLKEHKGKANVVGAREIAKFLEENGYKSKFRCINNIVKRVMNERNLPICSLNSKGYYWATSQEEIQECIDDLQSRICAMQERIKHLKNFMPKGANNEQR